jgi:protein-S-isoprenylcysteine O-methyltransferase Ste14
MEEMIRIGLPIYFVFYFGYVFIYKSRLVAKDIGKSPMVLPKDDSAYGLIGIYFKITHYLLLLYTIAFGIYPVIHKYLSPISILENEISQYIGIGLLSIALIWTIIAQENMKNAWRMGIDKAVKTPLITNGLFAYSRNPVFVGLILGFGGLFLMTPNTLTLMVFLLEFILIQIQIRLEEEHLEKLHGEPYLVYKSNTRRLI